MRKTRFLTFLAGPELGVLSTLIFVGLYTWPFLTFNRPSATFRFIFAAWVAHIVLIFVTSLARKRLEGSRGADSNEISLP